MAQDETCGHEFDAREAATCYLLADEHGVVLKQSLGPVAYRSGAGQLISRFVPFEESLVRATGRSALTPARLTQP